MKDLITEIVQAIVDRPEEVSYQNSQQDIAIPARSLVSTI